MSEHDRIHVTAEEGRLILAPSEPIVFQTVGISLRSVNRILEAHQLAPHRIRTFKLSNDPKFADKLRDVVGLYVDLPAHAVVLSVDEKSQIPLPKNMGAGGEPPLPVHPVTLSSLLYGILPVRSALRVSECCCRMRQECRCRIVGQLDCDRVLTSNNWGA